MIRGRDTLGNVILGITRGEIDGLLAGARCCFITKPELGGGPHICLWFAETDAELLARLHEMLPSGPPPTVKDYRTHAATPRTLELIAKIDALMPSSARVEDPEVKKDLGQISDWLDELIGRKTVL